MLKRATPFHPPTPARQDARFSERPQVPAPIATPRQEAQNVRQRGRIPPHKVSKILHRMPNKIIQQGRREPGD